MVEKALELNKKYPLFGVGVYHFAKINGTLRTSYFNWRLNKYTKEGLNKTGAHNSYVQLLAENGFWGLISVIFNSNCAHNCINI